MIRPFVQGSSQSGRRSARSYLLILVSAHVLAAGLVVGLLAQVGSAVGGRVPQPFLLGMAAAAVGLGTVVDLDAVRRRSFSLGLHRQTPKVLAHTTREWWVTPLIWGADTGQIWTTYRVSFSSWLLLLLAALGLAPAWAGLLYGAAFTVPLLFVIGRPPGRGEESCDVVQARRLSPRPAQVAGILSMLALPVGLLVVHLT